MWLIVLCSVTALAAIFERMLALHRASIHVSEFLRGLANLIKKENYAEALRECAATPGPVARVVHALILKHGRSRQDLREIAEAAAQLEIPRLERNLTLLSTIAYVAPLLGLLGTVTGLLEAFVAISSQSGYTTAAEIASGVYQSLLTTAAGLAVAIPAFVAASYLSTRVNEIIHDMERAGIEMIDLLDDAAGREPEQLDAID